MLHQAVLVHGNAMNFFYISCAKSGTVVVNGIGMSFLTTK